MTIHATQQNPDQMRKKRTLTALYRFTTLKSRAVVMITSIVTDIWLVTRLRTPRKLQTKDQQLPNWSPSWSEPSFLRSLSHCFSLKWWIYRLGQHYYLLRKVLPLTKLSLEAKVVRWFRCLSAEADLSYKSDCRTWTWLREGPATLGRNRWQVLGLFAYWKLKHLFHSNFCRFKRCYTTHQKVNVLFLQIFSVALWLGQTKYAIGVPSFSLITFCFAHNCTDWPSPANKKSLWDVNKLSALQFLQKFNVWKYFW